MLMRRAQMSFPWFEEQVIRAFGRNVLFGRPMAPISPSAASRPSIYRPKSFSRPISFLLGFFLLFGARSFRTSLLPPSSGHYLFLSIEIYPSFARPHSVVKGGFSRYLLHPRLLFVQGLERAF